MLLSLLAHVGIGLALVHALYGAASPHVHSDATIVTLVAAHQDLAPGKPTLLAAATPNKNETPELRSPPEENRSLVPVSADDASLASAATRLHIVVPPKPYYFHLSELTEQPEVLVDIDSDLGAIAQITQSQLAILNLLIDEEGEIDEVVMEDSLMSAAVQQLLKDAFLKTKFTPGKVAGLAVKSQLRIEVVLEGAAVEQIKKSAD